MTTAATYRPTGSPATERYEQVVMEGISPSIDGGRHPARGIVGDTLDVGATHSVTLTLPPLSIPAVQRGADERPAA